MDKLEYRMYGLVPYNISPIQQGIQFGHGVVEYMIEYGEQVETKNWAYFNKTFIILNGGTTNLGYKGLNKGSLNKYVEELIDNDIPYSCFYEPDLGGQLTSVNFLVDERVWDKEKYPDMFIGSESLNNYTARLGGEKNVFLRDFLSKFRLA